MARDYTTYDNNIRNELGSYLRNPTMAQPRVNQYAQPPRLNSDVSGFQNYANMASDLNNIYNTGSSVASAAGLGGGNAMSPAASNFYASLPGGTGGTPFVPGVSDTLTNVGGNLGGASNVSLNNFAGASKMLPMAAILAMGAFGMPSGKANIEKINRERRDNIIEQKINPFTGMMEGMSGMSNADLLASQRPPQTPWEVEEATIRASGVGDVDNEVETARMAYENNPLMAAQDAQFLAQGDNSKWYNPDMSRTNYMGEVYANSPGLTKLADASRNFFIPGTTIPLGHDNPTQAAVAQYQDYTGNPQDFVPDVGNNVPSTQPTLEPPGLFSGATRQGNIYGSDNRQTYNGKDLYADQTLYNSKKYKGY